MICPLVTARKDFVIHLVEQKVIPVQMESIWYVLTHTGL